MAGFDKLSFYERQHFHELEIKEKISARAQIAFAAIFATATVSVYILRVLDFSSNTAVFGMILPLMAGHIIGLLIATRHAIHAFWGNWFASMPTATEIHDYEHALHDYNSELAQYNMNNPGHHIEPTDVENALLAFVIDKYRICATHNAKVNKLRTENIHRCIRWLIYSCFPLFFSAALFVIFDMDASSPRKSIKINDDAIATELYNLNKTAGEKLKDEKK